MREIISPEIALRSAGMRRHVFSTSPKPLAVASNGATKQIGPTEDEVALAFAAEFHNKFAYDHTALQWRVYDNGCWKYDSTNLVFDNVRDFTRRCRGLINTEPKSMAKIGFAAAVEKAVRADRRMAVSHDVWDRNPWLLGVPGGVVNLRTGNLETATPDQYISRQTAITPAAPDTPYPIWSAFLHDATRGDAELQDFILRLIGYILTGDISEEIMSFIYGAGGNGKGVLIGTIVGIMADYAITVPIEVFTAGARLNLEYYRAQMAGARLVTAAETDAGTTWAEGQIKELTGNEAPISGRQPHGRAFNFHPIFKLTIVGNHAPKLKGRNAAMERRLRIIPFVHAPAQPDVDLKSKLHAEWPAILRWMIDGCLLWQRTRLGTATAVTDATGAYFEQQDAFGRWIDERCILDPAGVMRSKPNALLSDFTAWSRASGEEPVSANEFAELVDRHPGMRRSKSGGVRLVIGIGLRAHDAG